MAYKNSFMKVKEHYDNHLSAFYSWMAGDFSQKQTEQENFFRNNNVIPSLSGVALDLGAGHGLQSISLARLGFTVKAVDFSKQLTRELQERKGALAIEIHNDDLLSFCRQYTEQVELIVCMGDTLSHLESLDAVKEFVERIHYLLEPSGKMVFSFRDLTVELHGIHRFIPLKHDSRRILTCYLEYFPEYVMVHDLLYEQDNGAWIQKVSAYPKLRISEAWMRDLLHLQNIELIHSCNINGMIYLIGQRS